MIDSCGKKRRFAAAQGIEAEIPEQTAERFVRN
jgi:hypothetical protein